MDFIKVGAASPKLKISDTKYNLKEIETMILNAIEEEVKVLVFPELSISAYSCGDLFTNEKLIENCNLAIKNLVEFSKGKDILMAVGAPFLYRYSLYNCAYVILNGKVLGIVPKSYIPNYSEFYEKRWFTEGFNIKGLNVDLDFQKEVPFGTDLIFSFKNLKVGFEICEDLWVTTTMVIPSLAKDFITPKTSPTISGSKADVGSSKSITSGSIAKALAIAILCFCPPERELG